jgi:hypothetical protein
MSILGRAKVIIEKTVGDQLSAAHLSGVSTLNVTDAREFAPGPGQVYVNGDIYSYTTADTAANTIALSTPTTAAYVIDERVSLYPLVPFKIAMVQIENEGASIPVFVPHEWMALMAEGLYDPGIEVEIAAEPTREYSYRVASVIGRAPLFDASTTPIVTSTAGGERVYIDGDGLTLFTNDGVLELTYPSFAAPYLVGVPNACGIHPTNGHVFVADRDNIRINEFGLDGAQVQSFSVGTNAPQDVVIRASDGHIFITRTGASTQYVEYNSSGTSVNSLAPAGATNLLGIALDPGNLSVLVCSVNDNTVRRITISTATQSASYSVGASPRGIATDAAASFYVFRFNGTVEKYNSTGTLQWSWASGITNGTSGIDLDPTGAYIFLTDAGNSVVKRFINDSTGTLVDSFSTGVAGTTTDNSMTVDPQGAFIAGVDFGQSQVHIYNMPGHEVASFHLNTATGKMTAFGVTITGNAEIDTISSLNGLLVKNPLTVKGLAKASTGSGADTSELVTEARLQNILGTNLGIITPTLANASTTSETIVAQFALPGNYFKAGRMNEVVWQSVQSGTATLTWKIHVGPLGTTADPVRTFTTTAAGAANAHQLGRVIIACLTDGAGGTVAIDGLVTHGPTGSNSVTGITAAGVPAVDTTVANYVTVSVTLGSSSQTLTMNAASISKMRG